MIKLYLATALLFLQNFMFAHENKTVPDNCTQLIMVLTDSTTATKGTLQYFERESNDYEWEQTINSIPVVLGRSGLGWGRGLNDVPVNSDFPVKREGDGRSPAGVFKLGPVFGYKSPDDMKGLKMPYIHVTELTECIDDINSQLYNQIVSRERVDNVDWNSSEKMRKMGVYYALGIVVEQNMDPIKNGAGSCIFLHNWAGPDEKMAGCTAMAPGNLKKIVYKLNEQKKPVLVQLTKELYNELKSEWELP